MARGRKTVREDRVTPPEGATVREGGPIPREGAATVREGRPTVREGRPTMREGGAAVRVGSATVRETATAPPDGQVAGWLPPALAADYRLVEPLPARGGEADLHIVEPRRPTADAAGPARRVAKIYRQGIMPKEEVVRRVREADPAHVVRIEDYGQDAGRWWELMEYAQHGSLRRLFEREGSKLPDHLVRDILRELNDALAELHGLSLEHRDLKPENVLVRSRTPLELVLTDFGISSLIQESVHFTGSARTIRYGPPEASGGFGETMIEATTWDYWSLGMMLVEMLQGEHPYDGLSEGIIARQLATQPVDELTEGVTDPAWRRLCRGLLRRTPSARWDAAAVSKWLADPDDPSLAVAQEAQPAAAGPTANAIDFDGAGYATPADLGAALSRDWVKAESFWKRRFRAVRTWLTDTLGLSELGDALGQIDDADLPLDAQVFSFIYHLAPDAPPRFRDIDISAEGLAALAERAVNDGDAEARDTLLAAHQQGIVTLAAALPGQEALAQVSQRWEEAIDDYDSLRSAMRGQGVRVPKRDDDDLARLLAASLPSPPAVAALRAEARENDTEDARRCRWFRELGTPEDMPAATLVMHPHLHARAAEAGRSIKTAPIRGGVGGLVVGALFGTHVRWAAGLTDFHVDSFEEFWNLVNGVLGLGVVLAVLLFVYAIYDLSPTSPDAEDTGDAEEDTEDAEEFDLRRHVRRRLRPLPRRMLSGAAAGLLGALRRTRTEAE